MSRLSKLIIVGSLILLPGLAFSQSASFYLSPASGVYAVGERFFINLMVNVEGIAINASQATITFSADKLEVVSISKGGSVFSLWVQEPTFSNSKGEIIFGGGLPNPGFLGSSGKILTVIFRGKGEGLAEVSLKDEKILANDAHGTDIFSSSGKGKYTIKKAEVVAPVEGEKPVTVSDNEPPYPFEILVDNEGDETNPSPLLYFETKDDSSGISHYEIKIGESSFKANSGETMPWRVPYLLAGEYSVSVRAFDKAGNYRESTETIKVKPIASPKIITCPKNFNSGEELLYLRGTGIPSSKVLIYFEKDGKVVKKWEAIVDESGEWSFANDGLYRPGEYRIIVRSKDNRGAMSDFSEPCFVKVILNALVIGPFIVQYKIFVIILIAVLALLIGLAVWLYLVFVSRDREVKKESKDLENKFFKEYYELREDIKKQLEATKKARKGKLTIKDKEIEESLIKNLKDVEEVIRRELPDIDRRKR